jgi:hypothetical protein
VPGRGAVVAELGSTPNPGHVQAGATGMRDLARLPMVQPPARDQDSRVDVQRVAGSLMRRGARRSLS